MTLPEALQQLQAAGKIKRAWISGMKDTAGLRVVRDGRWHPCDGNVITDWDAPGWRDLEPDLTDPATLGCLLALVREASGDRLLHVAYQTDAGHEWWVVVDMDDNCMYGGETEGAAIAAALIALAEGL
jgi:hypothetical protein